MTSLVKLVSMNLAELAYSLARIDEFLWPIEEQSQRRKRERILSAATDLFVRLGYRKTSLEAVAQDAGVAKGTIYLYYPNKAALVTHAIALEKRTHLAGAAPVFEADASAGEQLRDFIALGFVMVDKMPLTTSLIQGEHEIEYALREMDEQLLTQIGEQQTQWLSALLDAATEHKLTAPQLAMRSQVLRDLMFAVSVSQRHEVKRGNSGPRFAADYAFAMADILVNGVLNETQIEVGTSLPNALAH
ncbi:MAG: TetR/AcrR family transcriptional regulator [Pseudomonadales bacterium]